MVNIIVEKIKKNSSIVAEIVKPLVRINFEFDIL